MPDVIYIVSGEPEIVQRLCTAFEAKSCTPTCFPSIDGFLLECSALRSGVVLMHVADLCSAERAAIARVLERRDLSLVLAAHEPQLARFLIALAHRRAVVLETGLEPQAIATAVSNVGRKASTGRQLSLELLRKLTPRERTVLKLVIEGWPNKQIAHKLGRSRRTVESHRQRIKRRVHISSWPELVRLVVEAGFDRELGDD